MNLYKQIFTQLDRAGIDYIIVGGVAVNLYGYSRFTGDIDIILALNEKNIEKLDKLMHKLGYTERLPIHLKDLEDKKKLKGFMKEKGLKAFTFISSVKPQLDIDIIVEESLKFGEYEKRKKIIDVWDLKLPVCHIDDLIKMKKSAKREKDLLDLEALIKLKKI